MTRAEPGRGLGRRGGRRAVLRGRQAARGGSRPLPGHRPGGRGQGPLTDEGFAAEDEVLADLLLSDELHAGLYAFDLTQKRARKAAGAPDKSLARPVTKVGVVGAGLMAAQIALLFARRLEVPVVLTDLDQARLDAGVGHVHAEIAKLASRGRISADAAARLTGAGHRVADQGRVRGRRLRDRGRVRGARGQAAGLRRGRGGGPAGLRAGHQHLRAVGDRDGGRAGPSRARGRIPLLQPGGR